MAEVAGVVAGLAQRPQHHARKALAAAARRATYARHRLAEQPGEAGRLGAGVQLRHAAAWARRAPRAARRALERRRLGRLVDAERQPAPAAASSAATASLAASISSSTSAVRGAGGAAAAPSTTSPPAIRNVRSARRRRRSRRGRAGPRPARGRSPSSRRSAATRSGGPSPPASIASASLVGQPVVASDRRCGRRAAGRRADLDGDRRSRSRPGSRLQRSDESRSGSIGSTRPGRYTEVARRAASASIAPPVGHERRHIGDVDEHAVAVDRQRVVVVAGVGGSIVNVRSRAQVGAPGRSSGGSLRAAGRPRRRPPPATAPPRPPRPPGRARRRTRRPRGPGARRPTPCPGAVTATATRSPGSRVDAADAAQRQRPAVLEERLAHRHPRPQRHLADDRRRRRRVGQRAQSPQGGEQHAIGRARRGRRPGSSGRMPRPSTTSPPRSVNLATVSLSAPPPASGSTACTVPLP